MIRRYIVRSAHGPLRPLWHACYATVLRAITLSLVLADRHASVYVAGSIGRGEPAFGLSDLDLLVITPADPAHPGKRRKRLAEHAHRIERLAPGPHRSSLEIGVCEPGELRRAVAATVFTRPTPGLLTDAGWRIVAGLQERPGVGDPLGRWRKLAGPERRPTPVANDRDRRRLASWLELQFWWRHAVRLCLAPDDLAAAHLSVKLVAEPVRTWLWLDRGIDVTTRREALLSGLDILPEEEHVLRMALELEQSLHLLPPAPIREAVGFLLRTTGRVAAALEADATRAGTTSVHLVGTRDDLVLPGNEAPGTAVPLADWRAIAAPRLPDEALVPSPHDIADPAALAAAARRWRPGNLPVLRAGAIGVTPAVEWDVEGMLRAVICRVTDPVSIALLAGERVAGFPRLSGWSAEEVAKRATDEHRAWLGAPGPPARRYLVLRDTPPRMVELARLLTAARAGLFAESIERGQPELAVAVKAAARCTSSSDLAESIEAGCDALGTWYLHGAQCPDAVVQRLRRTVLDLAVYRSCASSDEVGNGRSARASSLRR